VDCQPGSPATRLVVQHVSTSWAGLTVYRLKGLLAVLVAVMHPAPSLIHQDTFCMAEFVCHLVVCGSSALDLLSLGAAMCRQHWTSHTRFCARLGDSTCGTRNLGQPVAWVWEAWLLLGFAEGRVIAGLQCLIVMSVLLDCRLTGSGTRREHACAELRIVGGGV
jgi:hypothetical protein